MKKNIISCAAHLLVATCACECFSSNETSVIGVCVGKGDKSDNVGQDNKHVLSDVDEENDDWCDLVISPLTTDEEDNVSSHPGISDDNGAADNSNGCAVNSITKNGVKRPIPIKGVQTTIVPVNSSYIPAEMFVPSFSKEERFRRIADHLMPDDLLFNEFNYLYKARREAYLEDANNPDLTLHERFSRTLRYLESALILCQEILGIPKAARLDVQDFCAFLEYLDRTGGVACISQEVCDRLCNVLKEVFDNDRFQYMMSMMDDSDSLPKEPIIIPLQSLENEHPGEPMRLSSDLVQCHVSHPRVQSMLDESETHHTEAEILPAGARIFPAWMQVPAAWMQVPPRAPAPTYRAPVPPALTPVPPYGAPVPPALTPVPPYGAPILPALTPVPPYGAPILPALAPTPTYRSPVPPYRAPVPPALAPAPTYRSPVPPALTPVPPYGAPVLPALAPAPTYRAPVLPALVPVPPYGAQIPTVRAQVPPLDFTGLPANSLIVGSLFSQETVGENNELYRRLLPLDVIKGQFDKAAVHANNIREAIIRRGIPIVDYRSLINKRGAAQDSEGQFGFKRARTTEES